MAELELAVTGPVVEWRGPAPHHFVAVGEEEADLIAELAPELSYGWGCIPVTVTLGRTTFATSLFPRDGGYLVPLKLLARRAEQVALHDVVSLRLRLPASRPAAKSLRAVRSEG